MSTPNDKWMHKLAVRERANESDALPYAVIVLVLALFVLVVIAMVLR